MDDRPDIEQIRKDITALACTHPHLVPKEWFALCDYVEELECLSLWPKRHYLFRERIEKLIKEKDKRIGDYCYEPADIHIRVVNIDKDGNPTFDHPEYLRAGDGLTLGSGLYYRTSNKCKLCGSRLTRDDD